MANLIEAGDNPDLTEERRKATFCVRGLASFLYGGDEKIARRDAITKFVEETPELQDPRPVEFMTRQERIENAARKVVSMTNHADQIDASDIGEAAYYQNLVMARDAHPLALHYVMFLPTLQGQASDEQQEKWLPLAATRAIIGTYAQTELGHGTNLRKLETTATYDPKTQEFVMHSPTVTATKWWPGCLGKSSNYAIVVAQLWTLGKCYGPHPFMVQLRDLQTHQPLPGITVGDIGPKLAYNSNDNGFLSFDHVR
uniref:Acyl-coenzyme A oxidase N-terminal domain-containing protein n=1 Tax=Plectus sambesii TaxID=2011161 RepID=A0A914WXU4_9BILA